MAEVNVDRMVKTFCELVKIPSESPDDQKFIDHLEGLFKKMGGNTKKDSYGNLIVKFAAKNSTKTESIAFAAHADTVKPGLGIEPVIKDGIISSKGETILGADDKAAIAEMIELIQTAEKYPPIELLILRCEEIGSLGSINLDYSLVSSKDAYVMDMNHPEEVVVGGPTLMTLDVEYTGKPAHAGMAPEKGISAILAASKAISRLKLGKLDEESTANVGVINGGQIRNGVPDKTTILAECRCLKHEKALAIAKEMEKIFKEASDEVGTQVKIETKISLQAYLLDEKSTVVKNAVTALKKNGVDPKIVVIRGGTDATLLNKNGIAAAALGVGFQDIHSCKETAIISEMETMAKTMKTIVEDLA
jgi:tripeptide aminopeptidase